MSPWLGLDRQIQARPAGVGDPAGAGGHAPGSGTRAVVAGSDDPAGAGVSLSLGLDRQIQARPARDRGSGGSRGPRAGVGEAGGGRRI
ncbi:MAG: hypothetical protein M5U01_27295 [Ardenticatenaceae bacterium]|nr:hypothetical protein [Ardenticatenaceae bacterium]